MIHLDLRPEVEAQLTAEAQARGMAIDQYIEKIVQSRPIPQASDTRKPHSVAEAIDSILELREDSPLDGLSIHDLINEGCKF